MSERAKQLHGEIMESFRRFHGKDPRSTQIADLAEACAVVMAQMEAEILEVAKAHAEAFRGISREVA